jgi:copper resistance protein C
VIRRTLPPAVALLLLVGAATGADAAMHLRLARSLPAKDAVVASPSSLQLWFSLKPAMAVTTVKLTSSAKVDVKLGKPTHAGDAAAPVIVAVEEQLPAGKYTVSWKTASSDMHPVNGTFAFTVK